MDLEKIRRYSAQRFEEILRHFALASQTFDEEAIHQMRVGVKRLKALFHLLEELSEGFEAKEHLRPIRPVYKSAGRIRDLQVQSGLARQWMNASGSRGLEEYCRFLAEREEQARVGFGECCGLFDAGLFKARAQGVDQLLGGMNTRSARRRAETLLEKLQDELLRRGMASKAEDDLHPLRILAKRVRHTVELLQMYLSDAPPPAELLDAVKDIEQALGQWHDQEVAVGFAESFLEQSGPSSACREYMHSLAAKKRELRQAFLQALPELKSVLADWAHS